MTPRVVDVGSRPQDSDGIAIDPKSADVDRTVDP
jgi:hypothetical protein